MGDQIAIRSFAAGELSPAIALRSDLPVYSNGARRLKNFIVGRNGAAMFRTGTEFIEACKTDSANVKLVPFVHETAGSSVVIEFGISYCRFYNDGVQVTVDIGGLAAYAGGTTYAVADLVKDSGVAYYSRQSNNVGHAVADSAWWYPLPGNIYEIPSPFTDPAGVKDVQSSHLITFTSQAVRPYDLHYESLTRWWFDYVTTAPIVTPPTNVALSADGIGATHTFYDITVVVVDTDGNVSEAGEWSGELPTVDSGHHGSISWRPPLLDSGGPDIDHYEVYVGGTYVGSASGTDFDWDGSTPGGGTSSGASSISAPRDVSAEGTSSDPTVVPFRYVVTAVNPLNTAQESLASAIVTGDLPQPTAFPHRVTWDEVLVDGTPVTEYRVYMDAANGGQLYYVGNTSSLNFVNSGAAQDTTRTPPTEVESTVNPADPSTFPAVAAYFQQRRFIANTTATPDAVRGSRIADYSNFTVSTPLQDDDAISFRISGNNNHAVRWVMVLKGLLVFTDGGEWRVHGDANGALTPTAVDPDQETYVGCSETVRPLVVGNNIVYVQARGSIVRELAFAQQVEGLAGKDVTFFADHLVDGYTFVDAAFQQTPNPVCWFVRSDGALLGLSYMPERGLEAWHRHALASGTFERACVIPETTTDTLYVIVQRNGHRYVERLTAPSESVYVDSAVTYSGTPVTSLDGLDHLDGQTVSLVLDGVDRGSAVVSGGVAAFGRTASAAVVGLPIVGQLQPTDPDAPSPVIRGKKKRIGWTAVAITDASAQTFKVGRSFTASKLQRVKDGGAVDGLIELSLATGYDYAGAICLEHDRPGALTVLGFLPSLDLGA